MTEVMLTLKPTVKARIRAALSERGATLSPLPGQGLRAGRLRTGHLVQCAPSALAAQDAHQETLTFPEK